MQLYNKLSAEERTRIIDQNSQERIILSFYKYFKIDPLIATQRRKLYLKRHGKRKKGSAGYYANKILWGA